MLKDKLKYIYEKFKGWDKVELNDSERFAPLKDYLILKKFKQRAEIKTEEEEKVLDSYSLIGYVYWSIDPKDNYKPYAQLTKIGLTHLWWDEVLESKVRTFWQQLKNFAA